MVKKMQIMALSLQRSPESRPISLQLGSLVQWNKPEPAAPRNSDPDVS